MKKIAGALLALDIGNSTIGLGLYPDRAKPETLLTRKLSLSKAEKGNLLGKEIERLLAEAPSAGPGNRSPWKMGAIISSVVPGANRSLVSAVKKYCARPLLVDHSMSGLKFMISNPEKTGSDRIANAVAGFGLTGKPTAVIDFGSATTITVVSARKQFMGGAILPGLDMMAKALASGTAKLPDVEIERPDEALGSDTSSAIRSGIVLGTAGAVMKIVSSIEEETGLEFCIIITGGRAEIVSPFLERSHLSVPALIFEGLRTIYNASRDSR
jgi:type III pantothenate kinase